MPRKKREIKAKGKEAIKINSDADSQNPEEKSADVDLAES
jgi:hypothetical protein